MYYGLLETVICDIGKAITCLKTAIIILNR